ncbi:MAG: helix-turn-helix domain-containing protein [Candidatus Thermoplasmatota archaeon]
MAAASGGQDDAEPLPSRIQLPLPNGGDSARYEERLDGESTGFFTQNWGEEVPLADGQGVWHRTHHVSSRSETEAETDGSLASKLSLAVARLVSDAHWLDGETLEILAESTGGGGQASSSSSALPLVGSSESQSSVTIRYDFDAQHSCFLLPKLWAGIDLEEAVQIIDCGNEEQLLRAVAWEDVRGVRALRLDLETPGGDRAPRSFWVHPDLPFYVKTARTSDGELKETVLVGVERGEKPWLENAPLPTLPVPPAHLAKREVWGPSEAGIEHPFPLSSAWVVARDHATYDGLRTFLGEHPEARVCRANYDQRTEGERVSRSWMFLVVAENGDSIHLIAQRTVAPVGYDAFALLGLDAPTPEQAMDDVVELDAFAAESCPRPSEMASQLPSVASGWASWKAFTRNTEDPNSWSFNIDRDSGFYLTVGQTGFSRPAESPLRPSNTQGTFQSQHLTFDASGQISSFGIEEGVFASSTGGFQAAVVSEQETPPVLALAGLSLPSAPAAAGFGLLSLLVALGYYLLPVLKGGAVGLFSRVQESALLEHPARRRIVDAVHAQPGIHFQELVRALGSGQGATEHHVRKLVAAGLLVRKAGPGFTCYFAPGQRDLHAAAPALKAPAARRLLEAVRETPGLYGTQAALHLGLDASTVSYHAKRLEDAGLISMEKQGRLVLLRPTQVNVQV